MAGPRMGRGMVKQFGLRLGKYNGMGRQMKFDSSRTPLFPNKLISRETMDVIIAVKVDKTLYAGPSLTKFMSCTITNRTISVKFTLYPICLNCLA